MEKETIVLIHGLCDTREVWSRQVAGLQDSFNVITPDVRGFGRSPTGVADGTVHQFADDIAQLLSAMEADAAWLVGFSMGGVIAQQFAVDYPDLVKGLVLIASSCKVGKPGLAYFNERIEQVERDGLDALAIFSAVDARGCVSDKKKNDHFFAEYKRIRATSVRDAEGYLNACSAMLTTSGDSFTESINAIRHPTLVVAGELDPYCPPKASEMITNAIPNSSYLSIPDVGHCLHWEAADVTNDLISRFVNDNSQANKEFNREGL